ncbi:prolactin-releasing peptide receptor-like isoform X2 [Actinia tenebrosa]|uniref:Prolactin-releasing peptide receptor-like isoform X2 n=1 Tax=Actinia tenebrosa TaxID=6105 RepID=A0A6P8I2S8_ACTTE|nr:prolactin-releasing peptide receptor-like isoform X2 [Actinia tenebrosa]
MNLNNSSHANETLRETSGLAAHTKITLWCILLLWSLLGNLLVIAVVYCNQNLKTNMNYLIVNMAVSDLLVPLIALPWMISRETVRPGEWLVEGYLGEALCKLVPILSEIPTFVSSFNLVNIAFQRFIAVVYPTRIRIITPKTRWILVFFSWIAATALYSPYFYTYRLTKKWGYTMCEYSWSPAFDPKKAHILFYSILTMAGFIIPLIAIIILYTIIHYKLRESLNNVKGIIAIEMIRSRQQRNRRIFYMSITIIVVFTICWSPLGVLHFLFWLQPPSVLSMDKDIIRNMFFCFTYLWYFLAAINPCIYFLFLRDFRQGLKRLACRKTTNEQTYTLCVCCVRTVATDATSKKDPTCTPPHINTTSF